ncbi:DUF418 domain-containing protein [Psychrobacillus vulpis]|uniref:DUF418 domain-containing protein n=1 Tax=Psychrobacillus vulpis TaxID=2325572 RepID=A0A544TJ72_9BACI|nr:DUF418 domain-containing protein [Psychrobacillus vulpis]TQR17507.1 DUF418 domain-containing protein [Psychrobacillus vulpis]
MERVRLIDSLRGLSLFGILLANLLIFQYGIWGKDEISYFSLSSMDAGAYKFIKIVVEGSFMPIFTFLFGYSLIKLVESLKSKNVKVKRHLVRRFIILMVFGILHSTFLWEGDILTFYGLMGFFLLMFINRKKKTLIIWGIILFVLTNAMGYGIYEETKEEKEKLSSYIVKTNDIYKNDTYSEIKYHRNNEDPLLLENEFFILFVLILAPFLTAPLFLFGMAAAKGNMFTKPHLEQKWYKVGALLLPIGIGLKSVSILLQENAWSSILLNVGAQLLSIGYIAAFSILFVSLSKSVVFRGFESVGKLSLTNYIMQTVLCTSIFYGYGLGLFGDFGMVNSIILGLVIFALQCVCSTLYLKKFNRGPLEYILRMGTNFSWNGSVKKKRPFLKKSKKVEIENTPVL